MSETVAIWGSTGSVGQQTLDVIRRHPGHFQVFALAGRSASDQMVSQCREFDPKFAVVQSQFADDLTQKLQSVNSSVKVITDQNESAMAEIYAVDVTVTAVTGAAGLESTIASVQAGNRVLIANKEPVVMLGSLLRELVRKHGTTVLPVDSEHNAIFQCSEGEAGRQFQSFFRIEGLRRILLTGSGGPFLNTEIDLLRDVTAQQAVAHPVWSMGAKISVDSATMMNKGLEIIEARWLFDASPEMIQVVVHPQGIIHSMVEYQDGSVLAQMGTPDMRIPIANTLFWPHRRSSGAEFLDIFQLRELSFHPPDFVRFPCLKLAHDVARAGGTSAAVMNAANEEAVAAFLKSKIRFTSIADVVVECVDLLGDQPVDGIEQVKSLDAQARLVSADLIQNRRV